MVEEAKSEVAVDFFMTPEGGGAHRVKTTNDV